MQTNPICLYILCEGTTEETFVKQILTPYLNNLNIYLTPIVLHGVSKYTIIKKDLEILCKTGQYVTTLIDFYGLPSDTPGSKEIFEKPVYDKIHYIEKMIFDDISSDRLIPNLVVHEFEALLFSKPECFEQCDFSEKDIKKIIKIKNAFGSPELINNSPQTAPSKRIVGIKKDYQKITDGITVAKEIGIDTIRQECHHFDSWLCKIENLQSKN